ncbi:glutamate synthase [Bacillus sp. Xin]|uniref:glutamate synthase n=1 Tax=unclassified Bacillus (in: firmicutes) TaxID=185979 RepID=UPI0015738616|nr:MULTISPECIES: glutamate synthase [unclassified Bacillus (in: firmicutes)]MBC6973387.1 glutamate synthase [Bacillus sp. Xin]MCI0765816.1 glutamate synthase [Bacillus sp. TL12]NSW35610.1 glutamate synthase [Bacillus sp. Xin1]
MLEKAIVIGGSIAGKLAAKALSDFFQEVMILEAGEEWNEKSPRKKVPQTYHPHVLLKGGEGAIEKLFPAIMNQLKEDGGIVNNFTGDLKWHHFGLWKQPFIGELNAVQQSRPMLEWHIQKRMSEVTNITTKYETVVEQLIIDPHRNKISGVKTKCLITGMKKDLHADLVVDTSGFGSKNIEWLETQGIDVKEEKVWIQLFYATRVFRLKQNERPDWCNLLISPSFPENPYGAFIQTIEDNHYFVTFSGYANEKAPKTDEELLAFAHKLPAPDVIHFLEQAEPITDIKIHKIPYQVRRRFDLVKNMPEGFLVIGDAHCRFDPVFGQGISVAAMEAEELQMCLKKGKALEKGFTRGFYKRISKIIKTPWEMATTEAFRHPKIKGEKSFIQPFQQWYTKKIYQLSANNPDIYIRLVRVMNLMRSPLHLFHPKVWFAILKTRQK